MIPRWRVYKTGGHWVARANVRMHPFTEWDTALAYANAQSQIAWMEQP